MGNLERILGSICLFLTLFGCASREPYVISVPRAPVARPQEKNVKLSGRFLTTDQNWIDLSLEDSKPVVLMFSQDSCATCAHEADTLRNSLKNRSQNPPHVNMYTVLVSTIADGALEDANDWKSSHHVPWTVGIDPDSSLFKQYCNVLTVPCILVYLKDKGQVFQKNGAVAPTDLTALTGPWED